MKTKTIVLLVVILISLSSKNSIAQVNPLTNNISVDVSTQPQNSSFNYDSCFALGADLGMSSVGLHLTWTALETAPNIYNFSILDIANWYYPFYNMPIDLNIDPLETNRLEVPSDLDSMAFDNPIFINRFKILLDSVKVHIPLTSTLSSLIVGSEGDIYLGADAVKWQQYINFYDSIANYARVIWPGLKVVCEFTYDGLINQNAFAQAINANSDYIGVSYYPLNSNFTVKPPSVVANVFDSIVALYPTKPICFYQFGYPSSASCNSSETLQRQFIIESFQNWDNYAQNIKLIDFTWLHDYDSATVNFYANYYGISDTSFLEFLHTLGLRKWDGNGIDKPAFTELQCQAKQRGFNNLSLSCATVGLTQTPSNKDEFSLYPNPCGQSVKIKSPWMDQQTKQIQIFNALGYQKMEVTIKESMDINIDELTPGIYFLLIKHSDYPRMKFIKQ